MDYPAALAYWYDRIDFEKRTPEAGELKLDRMRDLLARVGNPHDRLKVIHIAGSKGKGTTAALFSSVLRAAGFRVGLFTSPHLVDVRERIQVNGEPISPDDLAARMTALAPHVDEMTAAGHSPTFFELATALGFLHFAEVGCEWAVVEVGLGGRFDSTNVVTPELSVITSISLDHTAILGNTVEQIAFEKAGIIKPGRPVVCGVYDLAAYDVIETVAHSRGAPFHRTDWAGGRGATPLAGGRTQPGVFEWVPLEPYSVPFPLIGDHQLVNACVAWTGIERLAALGHLIPHEAVKQGFASVVWPARLEWMPTTSPTLLDCAHNVASAEALATVVTQLPAARKALVFAASSDKDVQGMLRVLAPHFTAVAVTRYGDNPRAVPPAQLAAWLRELPHDLAIAEHATSTAAWQWAAGLSDAVVVAGSVFLAGELRPFLLAQLSPPPA